MIEQLRRQLGALERPRGIEDAGVLPLSIDVIDTALGGGLARGALHEVAALSEAHLPAAVGFVVALSSLSCRAEKGSIIWIAEHMALAESGAPYGPGLDAFCLPPERLVTITVPHRRDLLWAMEEALRCRALATVIGEMRHGEINKVAVRRLSLAAATSGSLALLLRSTPPIDTSTAATRWIVGAAPSATLYGIGIPRFAIELIRNRRGPTGSWILAWSESDERFQLATNTQPLAAPALDRSYRKIA